MSLLSQLLPTKEAKLFLPVLRAMAAGNEFLDIVFTLRGSGNICGDRMFDSASSGYSFYARQNNETNRELILELVESLHVLSTSIAANKQVSIEFVPPRLSPDGPPATVQVIETTYWRPQNHTFKIPLGTIAPLGSWLKIFGISVLATRSAETRPTRSLTE